MRKISLIVAALILAGLGAWAGSSAYTPGEIRTADRFDPTQMMINAKDLPSTEFVDYTFVFN